MNYQVIDDTTKVQDPKQQSEQESKQSALTQAQLEKEGQHKLWLEMPQTKELIGALLKAIEDFEVALDGCGDEKLAIKILARRTMARVTLIYIQTGKFK